jgi:hypothetical protein
MMTQPEQRSSTLVTVQPVPPQQPQQAITAESNNENDRHSMPDPSKTPVTMRKSKRVQFPTQAAIKSEKIEAFYGQKLRQKQRRKKRKESIENSLYIDQRKQARKARERATIRNVARMTVAMELLLRDYDEFAAQV